MKAMELAVFQQGQISKVPAFWPERGGGKTN
jgi:hypothetical protein